MRSCASHLFPAAPVAVVIDGAVAGMTESGEIGAAPIQALDPTSSTTKPEDKVNGASTAPAVVASGETKATGTETIQNGNGADTNGTTGDEGAPTPPEIPDQVIIAEASRSPLDGAIAASIAMCGTENKVKAAAGTILLIGGGSALKGLNAFLTER